MDGVYKAAEMRELKVLKDVRETIDVVVKIGRSSSTNH